ncbi:MAG TPA: hypothetical protein VJ953_14830 [Saprospiraceae bacterium]|nr:hypothetical protein [Saprospiraceae bacterium]
MEFIDEETIDQIAVQLGTSEATREAAVEALREEQPVLLAYLFSENFEVFLNREREYVLFLVLVIVESVKHKTGQALPVITEDMLGEVEESNWTKMRTVSAQRFRERLDVFFEDTTQEDLLAFVEDALIDEEEGLLSKEGREPIFIVLKSVIDALGRAQ